MTDGCRDTQCTSCIHLDVCSIKEKFLDAQRAVGELTVSSKTPDGTNGYVKLRDIGFIQPVELKCIHYIPKNASFTR